MKLGIDLAAKFSGLTVIHQNLPGKKGQGLTYPEAILFLPLHGEIQIQVQDSSHSLGPGRMFYLPRNSPHGFSSSLKGGERLIVMMNARLATTLEKIHGSPKILPCHHLTKEILFYLLLHPQTSQAKSLVQVFAETLAEILAEPKTDFSFDGLGHLAGKISDPRLQRAIARMSKDLSEPVSITRLASEAGLSSRNFQRLLVKETGLQPKQWLIHLRIEKARELLAEPGASVTQVALSVGYASLATFISAFRARTGRLPSDFLKN